MSADLGREALEQCKITAQSVTSTLQEYENAIATNAGRAAETQKINRDNKAENDRRRPIFENWQNLQGSFSDLTFQYEKRDGQIKGKQWVHSSRCGSIKGDRPLKACPSHSFKPDNSDRETAANCNGEYRSSWGCRTHCRWCENNMDLYNSRRPAEPNLNEKNTYTPVIVPDFPSLNFQCCANIMDNKGITSNAIQECEQKIEQTLATLPAQGANNNTPSSPQTTGNNNSNTSSPPPNDDSDDNNDDNILYGLGILSFMIIFLFSSSSISILSV